MGPEHRVIATAAAPAGEDEKQLEAARQAFPGWDFHQVFGGWEAVPAGTPVVRSMFLESLVERLRADTVPRDVS
jgi:hypothetical protein